MGKIIKLYTTDPTWYDGKAISVPQFCQEFLRERHLAYVGNSFFTEDGLLSDLSILRRQIFEELAPYVKSGVSRKIDNIVNLLKLQARVDDQPPQTDRIHVLNGTLYLDGTFTKEKNETVRSRFPVRYDPDAKPPERWLKFLSELLWPEDIPTVQEFIGYCLIPSNAGQKMLLIKGNGGEGKSQIGNLLSVLFGINAKNGSVAKVSENQFARADLEHIHLMIDDDTRLEALKQTNYVKSIVTAKGKMDLERKGQQSYQGWMTARIMAFSNGNLASLYDQSDGFFRRQLILETKRKPQDRIDDPFLSEKFCEELEGIFLWAFEGLQRLVKNHFQFTVSDRARLVWETVKKEANNIELFMDSTGYIIRGSDHSASTKKLYDTYCSWCDANAYSPVKQKTFSAHLNANTEKYGIQSTNHLFDARGKEVRGYKGISSIVYPSGCISEELQEVNSDGIPFMD
ncbi:MAG: phage/plasmid primase, P4 family [Clostridia bacterium]|nr:phage/plasmid primase, P4 family [Clostridia bacterium]